MQVPVPVKLVAVTSYLLYFPLLYLCDLQVCVCVSCVGGLLELKLAGCDGGQKEKGSGPENVLLSNWSCSQTRNYHQSA